MHKRPPKLCCGSVFDQCEQILCMLTVLMNIFKENNTCQIYTKILKVQNTIYNIYIIHM